MQLQSDIRNAPTSNAIALPEVFPLCGAGNLAGLILLEAIAGKFLCNVVGVSSRNPSV